MKKLSNLVFLLIGSVFFLFLTGCQVSTSASSTNSGAGGTASSTGTGATTSGSAATTNNTTNPSQTTLDGENPAPATPPSTSSDNSGNAATEDKPAAGSTVDKPASDKADNDPELAAAEKKLNAWKGGKLSPAEFAAMFGPLARANMKKTGVPASVTLAQAALETGWGQYTIKDGKNLFGIKGTGPAGSVSVPTSEFENGKYIHIKANFRKYHTWQESIDDHAKLLQGSRYKKCMANKNDPKQFARELKKAGYATAPNYADMLISIMNSHNFYKYDK